ncbi:MAG: hypothetical protein ABEJ70_01050 [Halobacteriaceae archaeon]
MGRRDTLERVAADVEAHEAVVDAWVAKSFTDRVLFVEVPAGDPVPSGVVDTLNDHGLEGVNHAYGIDGTADEESSFAGEHGGLVQHRFLDVVSRGRARKNEAFPDPDGTGDGGEAG